MFQFYLQDDSARVTRAFQILLKIIGNIVNNPEEEKFRRIRLSNPIFKVRTEHNSRIFQNAMYCNVLHLHALPPPNRTGWVTFKEAQSSWSCVGSRG
jgi:hypothetical protein